MRRGVQADEKLSTARQKSQAPTSDEAATQNIETPLSSLIRPTRKAAQAASQAVSALSTPSVRKSTSAGEPNFIPRQRFCSCITSLTVQHPHPRKLPRRGRRKARPRRPRYLRRAGTLEQLGVSEKPKHYRKRRIRRPLSLKPAQPTRSPLKTLNQDLRHRTLREERRVMQQVVHREDPRQQQSRPAAWRVPQESLHS